MERTLQPVVDHIVGGPDGRSPRDRRGTDARVDVDEGGSRRATTRRPGHRRRARDVAAATAQHYVERLVDPALRSEVIAPARRRAGGRRRAALRANPPPEGYVSPALTKGEEVGTNEEGFMPQFAIPARFGQITPATLVRSARRRRVGQRFTINIDTPAENAYVYEEDDLPGVLSGRAVESVRATVSRPGGRGTAMTVSRKVGTPTGTVLARCQVGAT